MELASARALKEEMRSTFGRSVGPRAAYRADGGGLECAVENPARGPAAAFGVAPLRGKRQYAVAVRVFAGHDDAARAVRDRYARLGRELDLAVGVRYEPRIDLKAGGSCGHFDITAGTLGGFVEDDDAYYVLSNNHVLANCDVAKRGDAILQPGPIDIQGTRFHEIAHLSRWIRLAPRGTFDAALAELNDDEVDSFYPWRYAGIGDIKRRPVSDRYATTKVVKRGRTTGVTRGRVSAYELDAVEIDYGTDDAPCIVSFDDQIEVIGDPDPSKPFSQPGDSGSFIIDQASMRPYALLYGGGPDDDGIDRTLGQFMPDVLGSLQVTLVR